MLLTAHCLRGYCTAQAIILTGVVLTYKTVEVTAAVIIALALQSIYVLLLNLLLAFDGSLKS
eukprot:21099-Heterococcus_DN1.PRE.2